MTNYVWSVTSGNFGAASSWTPNGSPTSSDIASIDQSTSLFGSGSAEDLFFGGAITVDISAALTTTVADYIVISNAQSQLTTVDVDAAWTATASITVGESPSGDAAVFVDAGGSISATFMEIGTAYNGVPGATGAVTVQGGGSVTTTNQNFDTVGAYQTATGTLTVTGAGSSWTSGEGLGIGQNGTGTLTVESSATLSTPTLDVGTSYGQPTIASGSGTVSIESGGGVTTTGSYQEIGAGATGSSTDATEGATGAVTVDGAGSTWVATNGAIEIGDAGSKSGILTISDDGEVNAGNAFGIGGEYDGADGSYGTLLIESGGTAITDSRSNGSGDYDSVGANYASAPTSKATVTGAGSSWKIGGSLGINESGQVLALSGGSVTAAQSVSLSTGALLQVDSSSVFEIGAAGGAAAGFLTLDAGANLSGAGVVDADMIDNGSVYANGGALTINGATGTAGTISGDGQFSLGSNANLVLNASVAASLKVTFGSDGTLTLAAPATFSATIQNYDSGDVIDLEGLAYAGTPNSYTVTPNASGGDTLVVTEGSSSITLDIGSSGSSLSGALTLSKDASGQGTAVSFANAACYRVGTRILTARGEVAIENIELGDLVVTASGATRPVVWLGHRKLDCGRHPTPRDVWPVRVSAGAFGEALPRRDLWLSPAHNIAYEGALIGACRLINGQSVTQVQQDHIEYWHVELDAHDVILAEGLSAESYLDCGNRSAFANGGTFIDAHPDFTPRGDAETCLPLAHDGPLVVAAKARLLQRLRDLGCETTQEPDAYVMIDGRRIEPIRPSPQRLVFLLPPDGRDIALCSRTFVPGHSLSDSTDPRGLGLCIGRLQIDGLSVALDRNDAWTKGWHEAEFDGDRFAHRWTTERAGLPAKTRIAIVDLAGAGHYWREASNPMFSFGNAA